MEKLGDFAGLSKAGEALNGWYTKHQTGIDTITTSVSTGLAAISGVLNALSLYAGKKRIKAGKDFLLLMSTLKEQAESLGLSAQHNADELFIYGSADPFISFVVDYPHCTVGGIF